MSAGISPQLASARLLVADDQPHILAALEILLHGEGYQTDRALNPENVVQALQGQKFDVVLMDLNYTRDTTGGAEGLDLVTRIRAIDQTIPLVVMTAWGNVDLAVEAMRRGASDFVQKPWSNHQLLEKVREQVERGRGLRSLQRRLEEEYMEARTIQKNLLPSFIPQISGYDISAITQPMQFVGGDYYNVEKISNTLTAFCIADVAGKGLPGALLMSNLQASLKPLIRPDIEPHELCNRLNQTLCEIMPESKFISLFYGVLDSKNHRFTYCNAGHNPPLLICSDGASVDLKDSGAILGRFPNWRYEQVDLKLNKGDTLLLFTDGVVEACDAQNEPFGEEKLVQIVQKSSHRNAAALQVELINAVAEHCGEKFQDDVSMIVLQAQFTS